MAKESSLVSAIRRQLRADGWQVFKMHGSATSGAGLPDLLITKGHMFVWLEVKTATGTLRPIQTARIAQLRRAGAYVFVVRSVQHARLCLQSIGCKG